MKPLLPLLLMLTGCADALGPGRNSLLSIEFESQRLREATMLVGDTLALTASLTVNNRPRPTPDLRWTSSRSDVATVSAEGLVVALSVGTTQVIVTSGAAADTSNVSVFPGIPTEASCLVGGGMGLAVGQVFITTAAAATRLCLSGGSSGSQYVLIPFHASAATQTAQLEIEGSGIRGPLRAEVPLAALHPEDAPTATDPIPDIEFDRRLREREAVELGRLVVPGAAQTEAPRFDIMAAAVPSVDDILTVNVNSQKTCTEPVNRRARVAAMGRRAIILDDLENPAGGFTAEDYRSFARDFDDLVYPTITQSFGEPTDIDSNGRIMILFTGAVNELTTRDSDSYVAGFFFGRDLFPRGDQGGLKACPASNFAEILYMLVPDPQGVINGVRRSRLFVQERTVGVLAHELQHLINASRRIRIVKAQNWSEEFWLNEGLSHIAEEMIFYASSPWSPRQNITIQQLRADAAGLRVFNNYQANNFNRLSSYLKRPEAASPISGKDLATRGASWAFLRYAADRQQGPERNFWTKIVDSEAIGHENLRGAIGASPFDWMHDWLISMYADDLIVTEPRFTQPSWHYRSVVAALGLNAGTYPLIPYELRSGPTNRARIGIAAGGAAFLAFSVQAGGRGEIATTSGGGTPPPGVRLGIVRTH